MSCWCELVWGNIKPQVWDLPCTLWWAADLWRWGSWQVWSCNSIWIPQIWAEHLWLHPLTPKGPWRKISFIPPGLHLFVERLFWLRQSKESSAKPLIKRWPAGVTWRRALMCFCFVQVGDCRQGAVGTAGYRHLDKRMNKNTKTKAMKVVLVYRNLRVEQKAHLLLWGPDIHEYHPASQEVALMVPPLVCLDRMYLKRWEEKIVSVVKSQFE